MKKEEVGNFINEWNMLIKAIIRAKKRWERLKKIREQPGFNVEHFPDNCQKVLARANFRSRFIVGIIRFLEYIERFSSFEECLIKVKKKKKEVEDVG